MVYKVISITYSSGRENMPQLCSFADKNWELRIVGFKYCDGVVVEIFFNARENGYMEYSVLMNCSMILTNVHTYRETIDGEIYNWNDLIL